MKRLLVLTALLVVPVLLLVALLAVPRHAAAEALLYAPLPADEALYSFADVYRLTVGATAPHAPMLEWLPPAGPAAGFDYQIRTVAEGSAPVQAAYFFSTASVSRPEGGLAFLAGLVIALWVAGRRLGYAIRA